MAHGRSPRHVRKAKPKEAPRTRTGTARAVASPTRAGKETPAIRRLEAAGEPVRLQRLLANAGFGSRREVETLVSDGRVSVNGAIAGLGDRARPGRDDIRLDGERVLSERPAYWLVNKPRGVVTTVRDESGRRTVLDLLPRKVGRVFPVGRLDVETSGLLLLTNDGETAYALLHPSLGNEREYRVSVKGAIDAKAIARIERGVHLEEGKTAPGKVRELRIDPATGTSSFSLTLVEGRNRQIRRSLLVLGFPVRRLVRERMGPLRLEGLAVGEARPLSPEERTTLLAHVERLRKGERPARPRSTARRKLGMEKARVADRPAKATGNAGAKAAAPAPARAGRSAEAARPVRAARPAGPGRPARPARSPRQRGASARKGDKK